MRYNVAGLTELLEMKIEAHKEAIVELTTSDTTINANARLDWRLTELPKWKALADHILDLEALGDEAVLTDKQVRTFGSPSTFSQGMVDDNAHEVRRRTTRVADIEQALAVITTCVEESVTAASLKDMGINLAGLL